MKERRERREEQEKCNNNLLKRDSSERDMILNQTKRMRLNNLSPLSPMNDIPITFPLTLRARSWPSKNEVGKQVSRDDQNSKER